MLFKVVALVKKNGWVKPIELQWAICADDSDGAINGILSKFDLTGVIIEEITAIQEEYYIKIRFIMEYICEMSDENCYRKCYHKEPHDVILGCFDENARCFVKGCHPKCIPIDIYNDRKEFIKEEEFEL